MKGINFKEFQYHNVIREKMTQIVRIINPQPICLDGRSGGKYIGNPVGEKGLINPRLHVGETVYLKEPYKLVSKIANVIKVEFEYSKEVGLFNLLDFYTEENSINWLKKRQKEQLKSKSGFCNKTYMPQWCALHFIKITGVKCERLQDISEEDCRKEGVSHKLIDPADAYGNILDYFTEYGGGYSNPREAYAELIDCTCGNGTWERNPFVWRYEFELIK
ncbi:MAG: hypothetical protein LBQ68_02685 [Clostridiales bacterium]|jgi:hypothetical protein|nr:hypothetical protein [Clostridiales bacterium]